MTPPRLELSNVSFAYGDGPEVLQTVSLQIQPGELFSLLGPNGAGKTTLIHLIAGLLAPAGGTICINAEPVSPHRPCIRSQIGLVFQSLSLDRMMTVEENLRFAGGLQGLDRQQTEAHMDRLLATLHIAPLRHKTVMSLSGGQQRTVDIARALIHQPGLLILDEPTTGLDPIAKDLLWQHLRQVIKTQQLGILMATHMMDEASSSDRVSFLNKGRLLWVGTPGQALEQLPPEQRTKTQMAGLSDWFRWQMPRP